MVIVVEPRDHLRKSLVVVLVALSTVAVTWWGAGSRQSSKLIDPDSKIVGAPSLAPTPPVWPRLSWQAVSCTPGSEIFFPARVKLCVGATCATGNANAPTLKALRVRETRLRHVNRTYTNDDDDSITACSMHRSGVWVDADTGKPIALDAAQLKTRATQLLNLLRSRGCTLSALLGADVVATQSCLSDFSLTAFDAVSILFASCDVHQRRGGAGYVLFSGDSIMRQLHARLVQVIRSIPAPIFEHTSLGEVTYLVHESGDDLVVRSRWLKPKPKSGAPKRASPMPPAWPFIFDASLGRALDSTRTPLARIDFTWQATLGEYNPQRLVEPIGGPTQAPSGVPRYLYPVPALHAHAFMFWNGASFDEERMLAQWSAKMNEIAQVAWGVGASIPLHASTFVSVTTPMLETGPGYSSSNEQMNAFFRRRNALVTSWTTALKHRTNFSMNDTSVFSAFTFDMASIVIQLAASRTNGTMAAPHAIYQGEFRSERKDDKHFMCTADPKLPAAVSLIRVDRNGCHDRVNLALVERLLAVLLLRTGG